MRQQPAFLVLSFLLLLASVSSVSATSLSYTNSAHLSWTFSGISVSLGSVAGGYDSVFTQGNSFSRSFSGIHDFGSSTVVAPGGASVGHEIAWGVTALEPGWSTITVNYQLQETGTVPVGGILTAFANIGMHSSTYGIEQVREIQTTVPADQSLNIARTITGIFTGSAFFDTIGRIGDLVVVTNASSSYRSVPGPDTFWLLLGGLAALVACRERLKAFT